MRILQVLTYYRPHTSGLTFYVERIARALVRRGHQVTIMTTQYDRRLKREEWLDGVHIIRVPVAARVSKGVLAPTFGYVATRLVWQNDVVHAHLPQFDAPGVAFRGRLFGKPVVLTYHCDLEMPPGLFNQFANWIVHFQNHLAGSLASTIVTYTQDYAESSAYLRRFMKKLNTCLPPVEVEKAEPEDLEVFAKKHRIPELRPVIGMAARFAAEKGVEILLEALPMLLARFPKAQVLFAGQYENVLGEQAYAARLLPRIGEYQASGHWTFLGTLDPRQMASFFPNLDVLVVPSLNSTESFGLVQIEAMLNNVPCVASSLPGVRQPILMHGMGRVVPVGDPMGLAEGIIDVIAHREKYLGDIHSLSLQYAPDRVAREYEYLFGKNG